MSILNFYNLSLSIRYAHGVYLCLQGDGSQMILFSITKFSGRDTQSESVYSYTKIDELNRRLFNAIKESLNHWQSHNALVV